MEFRPSQVNGDEIGYRLVLEHVLAPMLTVLVVTRDTLVVCEIRRMISSAARFHR